MNINQSWFFVFCLLSFFCLFFCCCFLREMFQPSLTAEEVVIRTLSMQSCLYECVCVRVCVCEWGLAVIGASSAYFSAAPSSFVFHPWLHPPLPTLPKYPSVAADSTATPQLFCFDFPHSFDEIDMTGFASERQHQAHSVAFYYLAPDCFLQVPTAAASFMWEQILWSDKYPREEKKTF